MLLATWWVAYIGFRMKNVIERIMNLLAFLLTAGRPATAEEIRDTVAGYDRDNDEAFHRMFERDKDLLRNMGIPLELVFTDAWEVEQGYLVDPTQYELPDIELTDEERAALWLASQVVRLGGESTGHGALLKLGGAPLAGAGEPLGANLGLAAEALETIFLAISERRALEFVYRERAREIHPYGLRHQRGHWYVVGEQRPDGEVRAYRVDRGSGFRTGEAPQVFRRPADFSIRDALPSTPWESGTEDIEAIIRFDAPVAWWAQRQLSSGAIVEEEPDGSLVARLSVANPDALIGWLLTFADQAELLAPAELRQQLVDTVNAVSA